MGVPGLKRWINYKFKKDCFVLTKTINTQNLYIDGNGLLHKSAQKIYGYGEFNHVPNDLPKELLEIQIFEDFFLQLYKIITKVIIPTELIYVAFDGTAPNAKQAQQRQRRFNSSANQSFNSNCITPGTKFMDNLTDYCMFRFRKMMNSLPSLRGVKIVLSSSSSPGEGEHKIMDFIRKNPSFSGKSHCMYGPDADLIMLCLATYFNDIVLVREMKNIQNEYEYQFINIGEIRKALPKILRPPSTNLENSRNNATNDFIFIGFFVGNDFLPMIPMFNYLFDGMRLMVEVYQNLSQDPNHQITKSSGRDVKINFLGFKRFVQELAKHEKNYLIDQITNTDERRQPPEEKYINKTLKKHIKHTNRGFVLDFDGYRADYYRKIGMKSQSEINKLCDDYLATLVWVFDYYTRGITSWHWRYEYHYAPLMFDFLKRLNQSNQECFEVLCKLTTDHSVPVSSNEQILAVFPPSSYELAPVSIQPLFFEGGLVESGMFPLQFEKDFEGKLKEHEAQSLIPFADYGLIKKAIESVGSIESVIDIPDDVFEYVFEYDCRFTSRFDSKYGNILINHVKLTLVTLT